MILLNINEAKCYIYKEGFAEDIINDMFKDYFDELYQEDTVKWRIDEMWEKILIKIPKRAVLIEKDSILYSVNSDLKFKIAPEDFFEIDEVSHPVLIDCFNKCYSEFKNLIENYRLWSDKKGNIGTQTTDSIANIFLGTSGVYKPHIESLSETLNRAELRFNKILDISLKPKMANQICPKIVKTYESSLLQINPIILITKTDSYTQKIYAVADNLEVEEVTYSLIERELEEIIHGVVPKDTEFLVNRIYNFMMLPLTYMRVKPYIRINRVHDTTLNATIFLKTMDIPVICNLDFKEMYAFLKVKANREGFPYSEEIRYGEYKNVNVESMKPEIGVKIFSKINKSMFDDMSCYVEVPGKRYIEYIIANSTLQRSYSDYNILYKMDKGKLEIVYGNYETEKHTPKHEKFKGIMDAEYSKVKKQGSYAFWKITFKES